MNAAEYMRQLMAKIEQASQTSKTLTEETKVEEKWGKSVKVSDKKKGMFDGWTLDDLRAEQAKLKKSGPHEKGSAKYTRTKEVNFAIRAKTGWGKAK